MCIQGQTISTHTVNLTIYNLTIYNLTIYIKHRQLPTLLTRLISSPNLCSMSLICAGNKLSVSSKGRSLRKVSMEEEEEDREELLLVEAFFWDCFLLSLDRRKKSSSLDGLGEEGESLDYVWFVSR